ncbi:MAG: hypothetical protein U0522_01620 [Candidatus Paceibacterota bacterium]
MDILEKVFGSGEKVRLMRLFMFNPNSVFDLNDIAERTDTNPRSIKKEIINLEKIELIKSKVFVRDIEKKRGKKKFTIKKKSSGWTLNQKFQYLRPLQDFLVYMNPFRHNELIEKLRKIGNIKLLVISGVFIQEWESRVDLFLVGDNIKKGSLDNVIRGLESELGKELKYAALETGDFHYRLNMCDKLISDVLDFPHEKVINKIGIE